jgi:hypothetical protein
MLGYPRRERLAAFSSAATSGRQADKGAGRAIYDSFATFSAVFDP